MQTYWNVSKRRSRPANSNTLLEFLKDFVVGTAAPVNIYVVGHSKGGALAAALALWLADTQSGAAPNQDQWGPGNDAKVHLYSFAAPTAGNTAFADRFTRKIKRISARQSARPSSACVESGRVQ